MPNDGVKIPLRRPRSIDVVGAGVTEHADAFTAPDVSTSVGCAVSGWARLVAGLKMPSVATGALIGNPTRRRTDHSLLCARERSILALVPHRLIGFSVEWRPKCCR